MYERLLHVQLGCEISRLSHVTFNALNKIILIYLKFFSDISDPSKNI